MPLYLAPYVGSGTKRDPYKPRIPETRGWSSIDLRPDCSKVEGKALLWIPEPSSDPHLELLGYEPDERVAVVARGITSSRLGFTANRGVSVHDTLGDLLMDMLLEPPSVQGWKPLQPSRSKRTVGRTRVTDPLAYDVWLGRRIWKRIPIVQGGLNDAEDWNRADADIGSASITDVWTVLVGSNAGIVANRFHTADSFEFDRALIRTSLTSVGADHFAEYEHVPSNEFGRDMGAVCRMSSGPSPGWQGYFWDNYVHGPAIWKLVSGTATQIDTADASYRFQYTYYRTWVSGSTVRAYQGPRGAQVEIGSVTDTSLATGDVGLFHYSDNSDSDNWRGGDGDGEAAAIVADTSPALGVSSVHQGTTSTSCTLTVAAGNTIVFIVATTPTVANVAHVSDTQGNSYTRTHTHGRLSMFRAVAGASGSVTITAAVGGNSLHTSGALRFRATAGTAGSVGATSTPSVTADGGELTPSATGFAVAGCTHQNTNNNDVTEWARYDTAEHDAIFQRWFFAATAQGTGSLPLCISVVRTTSGSPIRPRFNIESGDNAADVVATAFEESPATMPPFPRRVRQATRKGR